jgi:hypothetical protein
VSALEDTNLQIRAELVAERRRRAEEARAVRPIRIVDGLVSALEELHLAGRKRVPETLEGRLAAFQDVCPLARGYELRSRITIARLMDQLYEIQELLLETKSRVDGESPAGVAHHLSEAS